MYGLIIEWKFTDMGYKSGKNNTQSEIRAGSNPVYGKASVREVSMEKVIFAV